MAKILGNRGLVQARHAVLLLPTPKVRDLEPGTKAYAFDDCKVLVSESPEGWHMSISHANHYPTWDEIRDARYEFIPDAIVMAMLLPPRAEYVNLQSNTFHLWEIGRLAHLNPA